MVNIKELLLKVLFFISLVLSLVFQKYYKIQFIFSFIGIVHFFFLIVVCFLFVVLIEQKKENILKETFNNVLLLLNVVFIFLLLKIYILDSYCFDYLYILVERMHLSINELSQIIEKFESFNGTKFSEDEKKTLLLELENKSYKEIIKSLDKLLLDKQILLSQQYVETIKNKYNVTGNLIESVLDKGESIFGRDLTLREIPFFFLIPLFLFLCYKGVSRPIEYTQTSMSPLELALRLDPNAGITTQHEFPTMRKEWFHYYRIRKLIYSPSELTNKERLELIPEIAGETRNLLSMYEFDLQLKHTIRIVEAERLYGNTFSSISESLYQGISLENHAKIFHLLARDYYLQLVKAMSGFKRDEVNILDVTKIQILNQYFRVLLELDVLFGKLMLNEQLEDREYELYARIFFFRNDKVIYNGEFFDEIRSNLKREYDVLVKEVNTIEKVDFYYVDELVTYYLRSANEYDLILHEVIAKLRNDHSDLSLKEIMLTLGV